MGLDDIVEKAKGLLGGEEAAEDKVDQAAELIKEKTPDQADGYVDKAADAVKGYIDTDGK